MRSLLSLLIIILSFSALAQNQGFVKGELLVQLKSSDEEMVFFKNFEVNESVEIHEVLCLTDIVNIYHVKFENENANLDDLIKLFYRYPQVINAQKNHYVTNRETIPTDTLFNNAWHLKNVGQTGGTIDADIDATEAWDITTGGVTTHDDTIVVCIIEGSGVDLNHVDLFPNRWYNYVEIPGDLIDNDNNGYVDDYNGWNVSSNSDIINSGSHGTRVAGMVGAKGNNITGMSGVNWNVKLMVVEGQAASNEASVIAAYSYPLKMRKMYNESYGAEGAFVVVTNASWGIDNGDPADAPLWCAMYDSLGSYGILNIAATTNNNSNVDVSGDLPTTCPSPYLIGVTMTNSDDVRANSGYGTTHVDLAAPGSNVQLPIPGNFYSTSSGTSFASPLVAGCVALAYSVPCAQFINYVKYDPAGAALDMRNYILNSVDLLPALSSEVGTGGRMNVNNAIDSILSNCDPSTCIPPYNVIASNITDSVVDIIWSGFSTDYILYIQEGSGPIIEIPVTAGTTYNIDTLFPCTYYSVWVKADCGTDTSDYSFVLNFWSDGCCENPDLILDSKGEDSLTISWNPVLYATNYDVRYRINGESLWESAIIGTNSPLTFTNLLGCTEYEFQIKTTCTDSTHGYSDSFIFRTLGCGACVEKTYCSVEGSNTSYEWIEHIALNTFANNSGDNNGWFNSEQLITALTPGLSYPMELTPGYAGFNFTERFTVWIDLNHDGVFDAGEMLINDESTNTSLNTSLSIPIGATIGVTRMRIGMRALTGPDECPDASFFGEYEDYCVYIGPQADIPELDQTISVYPNPVNNQLYIQSQETINAIEIFSYDGKLVLAQKNYLGTPIDVSNLAKGMYIVEFSTASGLITKKFVKS